MICKIEESDEDNKPYKDQRMKFSSEYDRCNPVTYEQGYKDYLDYI